MRVSEQLCFHEGRELIGQERADTGLGNANVWLTCGLGLTKNPRNVPGVVCRSNGCGPECEKFQAMPKDDKEPQAGENPSAPVNSGEPTGDADATSGPTESGRPVPHDAVDADG